MTVRMLGLPMRISAFLCVPGDQRNGPAIEGGAWTLCLQSPPRRCFHHPLLVLCFCSSFILFSLCVVPPSCFALCARTRAWRWWEYCLHKRCMAERTQLGFKSLSLGKVIFNSWSCSRNNTRREELRGGSCRSREQRARRQGENQAMFCCVHKQCRFFCDDLIYEDASGICENSDRKR